MGKIEFLVLLPNFKDFLMQHFELSHFSNAIHIKEFKIIVDSTYTFEK